VASASWQPGNRKGPLWRGELCTLKGPSKERSAVPETSCVVEERRSAVEERRQRARALSSSWSKDPF
jgi:hypothetical protein